MFIRWIFLLENENGFREKLLVHIERIDQGIGATGQIPVPDT